MAHTKINTQVIPDGTIVSADLSMPITGFSSTGIDDNASSTAITINSSENVGIGTSDPSDAGLVIDTKGNVNTSAGVSLKSNVDTYLRFARFGTAADSTITLGNNYNRNSGSFVADNSAYPVHNITFHTDGSIRFGTGAAGSTSPTQRIRIDASGIVTGLWSDNGTANSSSQFVKLTQAEYDALTPDANTIYFIV